MRLADGIASGEEVDVVLHGHNSAYFLLSVACSHQAGERELRKSAITVNINQTILTTVILKKEEEWKQNIKP